MKITQLWVSLSFKKSPNTALIAIILWKNHKLRCRIVKIQNFILFVTFSNSKSLCFHAQFLFAQCLKKSDKILNGKYHCYIEFFWSLIQLFRRKKKVIRAVYKKIKQNSDLSHIDVIFSFFSLKSQCSSWFKSYFLPQKHATLMPKNYQFLTNIGNFYSFWRRKWAISR